MKRSLGCLSVSGLVAALVIVAAVALHWWAFGATLFSPGPLSAASGEAAPLGGYASHAEMETRCTLCHLPWKGVDPARCLACHTVVDEQMAAQAGPHGWLDGSEGCTFCHPEHQGRERDIARAALERFPHDRVGFSLVRHRNLEEGAALACADCHGPDYAFEQTTCIACHGQIARMFMARHTDLNGTACLSCHDGTTIPDDFDHDAILSLQGGHGGLACDGCHRPDSTRALSAACATCHEEPGIHRGQFGRDCAACHTALGWQPARLRYHAFPLDHGQGKESACTVCHPANYAAYTCYGCHEHQPAEVGLSHRERGVVDIGECVRCHPAGQEMQE